MVIGSFFYLIEFKDREFQFLWNFFNLKYKENTENCDISVWLNYRDLKSYNRIAISKCNQNSNSVNCGGCLRTLKTSGANINSLSEISWNLVATFDIKNLNYLIETYFVDMITNLNDTTKSPKLKPFWQNVKFPSIKVFK